MHSTAVAKNPENVGIEHHEPAIVIAAFGSTRSGRAVFNSLHEQLARKYGEQRIHWAYTSKTIRRKSGGAGLQKTLTTIESAGYSQALVLPLQLFPGGGYQRIQEKVQERVRCTAGLQIVTGETLMHRWSYVKDVLAVVEQDFLRPDEGLNLIALHGAPVTSDPANGICLGIAELVGSRYANVMAASLEGVPDQEAVLQKIARCGMADHYRRIRLVPLLYTAGMHVEDDLMGQGNSWKNRLQAMGFEVDCLTTEYEGETFYKSLAAFTQVEAFWLKRVERGLQSF
ncbi:MAG: sirohydrochlorin cobaltochelatase [Desulfopila sp.]